MNVRTHTLLLIFAATLVTAPVPALGQTPSPAGTASIRGGVADAELKSPVGQAEVVVVGASRPVFTDEAGRFSIDGLAPGTYVLSVLRMGFVPLRRSIVLLEGQVLAVELALTRSAIPLEAVTVTPGSFSFMGQTPGTRQSMSREDVEAVPQIGNDIFRAVNRLPGLSSNDYAAHFGIRGGRHDETLILLDGLELHEPYHLKDFNEGAISIIDASTIDGVQLMTGGFPARFGNKRSGVFDITSRTPDPERAFVDVGTSFLNSHAMAMGPFAGGKGSWLAFARTGYMGLVFQFIDQADLPRPQYEDVFAKARYRFGPGQELSFDVLHAGDRYTYDIAATTGFSDTIHTRESARTRYANSYVWTSLESALGEHASVRTTFSSGWVNRDRDGQEKALTLAQPYYAIANQRRYSILGLTQDWTLGFSERDIVTFGADYRQSRNRDDYQSIVYGDPDDPTPDPGEFPYRTKTHLAKSGTQLGAYVSNRLRVLTPLVVETGARFDRASWTGDHDWSPRVSAALMLGGGMTLRAGWGVYRQMQGIDDVAALNGPARYYRSEKSEQWTASWDRTGAKGSVVRIEGYTKRGSQLRPVFRNWKGAIDAFPESNEDRILVFPRRNRSRGIETYFEQPLGRRVTARASYAYAITDEELIRIVNVNSPSPLTYDLSQAGPQDQRHAANMDFTYRVGGYSLNSSFAFHSGWPTTLERLVPVVNENGQPDTAVRPQKLYGARLADYLRLDMRATRHWATRMGDFGLSVEVINLTNHSNVFGYDYFKVRDGSGRIVLERGDETWFSTLPSLGLTWSRNF